MSDCGCATPPPPAEFPIASSDCACGLPEAFRAAQTYAEETNAKLARLWPYREMYGPILRERRREQSAARKGAGRVRGGLWGEAGGPPNEDGPESPPPVLEGYPETPYFPPDGAQRPSTSGCEGWSYWGAAAPLFDPLAGTLAGCNAASYLGWWMNATSPGTLSMGGAKRRIYVHNAALAGSDPGLFPVYVADASGNKVAKFGAEFVMPVDLETFWKAQGYANTTDVRDLHFSAQFVAFLDSEDGVQYPLLAPMVLSTNSANPCDFGSFSPTSNTPIVIHSAGNTFRSGWRSTIIPCAGAEVVYQVDSVLCVTHERLPLYLLFAVQCQGHYDDSTGTVVNDAGCVACNPCPGSTGQYTPVTRYVVFACRDPDFQDDVFGPFDLLDAQDIPDASTGAWIGVPQAFLSPDGEYLFLYVVSRGGGPLPNEGLRVAQIDTFLAGLEGLVQLSPAQGPAPLVEDPARQTLGQTYLAPTFSLLGPLSFCFFDARNVRGRIVDEHFVFCDGLLHLYFTHLADELDKYGNVGGTRLREFLHASARRSYDSPILGALTVGAFTAATTPYAAAQDMCTTFDLTQCPPLDIDAVFGEGVATVQHQDADGTVTTVRTELNDPTVFPTRPTDIEHGQMWDSMAMLFGSSALRALAVAVSYGACVTGRCASR